MRKLMACLVALTATGAANAAPILFDFESSAFGSYNPLVVSAGGVTATITVNGGSVNVTNSGGGAAGWGSHQLLSSGFAASNYFQINFSQPLSNVSIDFSDYFADSDTPVTMDAFSGLSGTGALVGSDSEMWPATSGFPAFGTLSISSATPFQSIRFIGGGAFPNSLYWDNLRVELAAVPEPLSIAVFGGVLAAGGLAVRRRMKATA